MDTVISLVMDGFVTISTNVLLILTCATAMQHVLIGLMVFLDMSAHVLMDILVMDSNVKMKTNVI